MYDLILLAAGKEKRFDKQAKVLIETCGKPLICHPLETFDRHKYCRDIIIVTREEYMEDLKSICEEAHYSKVKNIVLGGEKRPDSVLSGLIHFSNDTSLLAIHGITYPFVTEKELTNLYYTAREEEGAVLGHPLEESVKVTNPTMHIVDIEMREDRWITHSPTMTTVGNWKSAYEKVDLGVKPTDEAALLERAGLKIQIVPDFRSNIPIYTTYDWKLLCDK